MTESMFSAKSDPALTTASRAAEQSLVRAAILFRAGGLAQIAIVLLLSDNHYRIMAAATSLVAAVIVESVVLITLCVRAGRLLPNWVCADVVFCMAGLSAGDLVTAPRDGYTWADFMYPFTIITSIGIGMTYRRLAAVETLTTLIACSYALSAVLIHRDQIWTTVPNGLTYIPNTTVAWFVARHLRGNGRAADAAKAHAVLHAERSAQQAIRAQHARALHDRALQTLETLARGSWITDSGLRAHVAAEAAWLRSFVENDDSAHAPTDLIMGLQELVQGKALTGLHVELATAALRETGDQPVDPRLIAVILDAVSESLTNVAKHAGVSHATVRGRCAADTVEISITDQGCGFDPAHATSGLGLRRSVIARLTEIGGTVSIDSRPGDGTRIRLLIPRGRPPLPDGYVTSDAQTDPGER